MMKDSPATSPARIPSVVLNDKADTAVFARLRMSTDLASSSDHT
jgi:hypothetical protein